MISFLLAAVHNMAIPLQAAALYPGVRVQESPAEGGMLVACHGGVAQESGPTALERLRTFSEVWNDYLKAPGRLAVRLHSCCAVCAQAPTLECKGST